MNRYALLLASLLLSLCSTVALRAFEDPCFLHPAGSIQNVTGHNCPFIPPFWKTEVGYQCESCGDYGSWEDMDVTGYGTCFLDGVFCPPYLNYIDYQALSVKVSVQNVRHILAICYDTEPSVGTATCFCPICNPSPIIISLEDSSIRLTDAEHGVLFDLDADGLPNQTAWTRAGSDEAFLALDRNGNSVIDDGTELFGDHTPQPIPDGDQRNGFAALAVFDDSLNGGNEDGVIDESDDIFSSLRLWIDINHNGLSEPEELLSLPEGEVAAIDLDYQANRRRDRHGNLFRFRTMVEMQGRTTVAWDVFFVQQE